MRLTRFLPSVVGGQHGREFFRHWCARQIALLPGLCRCHPRVLVLQPPRRLDRVLLLLLRSRLRSASNGAVPLLVRLVPREVQ